MSNSLYQDSFANARPNMTYQAVSARLSLTKALTQDLASYYHERSLLEENYVKSLQKLQTRLHQAGSHTVFSATEELGLDRKDEQRQMGAWTGVRSRLEAEISELVKVHETWRKKTIEEVESPLRQSLGSSDWQRWQQGETTIGGVVREYEGTLEKVQKAQSKEATKSSKSSSSKLLNSQSQLATLGSSLKSALPAWLVTSQRLDESHNAFLKEALVRSGTFTSDLGRERMEAGERLLVSVLGVDEQAEIQGWALRESMRAGGNTVAGAGAGAGAGMSEFGTQSITSASGWNGARAESIAEEPEQDQNQRTPTQERVRASSNARTAPPPVAPLPLPTPPAPTKSSGGFKFSKILKRDRASSGAASSKYGNLDTSQARNDNSVDRRSIISRDSDSISNVGPESATRSSLAPQVPRMDRTNSGSSSLMGGSGSGMMQAPIMPTPTGGSSNKKRDSLMPFSGGAGLFRRSSKIGPSPTNEINEDQGGLSGYSQGTNSTMNNNTAGGATIDEEGYSVPPAGYDKQPWETTPAAGSSNLMDDDDEDEMGDTAAPLQSNKAPVVAMAPSVIKEDESERRAALEKVQSTLLSAGPASSLNRRTTRGRRDGNRMSTAFGATGAAPVIPDDMPLSQAIERSQRSRETSLDSPIGSSGLASPLTASAFGRLGSPQPDRAMSMLSTTSSARAPTGPDPFEFSTSPGLRAKIVETVNVLSKAGEVTRVMVTGELHLSHRVSTASHASPLRIRIAQFDRFEKAAPNSSYLSPVSGSSGEFEVSPSLAAQQGSTAVVLKYQVRVNAGEEQRYVPLAVKAMWKCEPQQTRLIVNYRAHQLPSSSPFGEDEESQIKDLEFAIPISSPVTTFQAKPSLAKWNAESSRLTFNIDESLSSSDSSEHKLLASVQTDGQAQAQPLAVKWTIEGRCLSDVGVEIIGDASEQIQEVRKSVIAGKFWVAP